MKQGFKVIDVNLNDGSIKEFEPSEDYLQKFWGGSGLAFRVAADEELDVDPLGADNRLMFFNGLLTGLPVPTACKGSLVARSPQTGLWSESTVGGQWPARFRACGYGGLIVRGKSTEPVYLEITADGLQICSAEHLWGLDTYKTSECLASTLNGQPQVACIGPAGENQVVYASVMIGGAEARAAGRTGMGAVMGAKNLKAVVVYGGELPEPVDQENLSAEVQRLMPRIRDQTQSLRKFGTAGGVEAVEGIGDLPIRNWRDGTWAEGARNISGRRMSEEILQEHYACHACPIRCGKMVRVRSGEHAGTLTHGPEYETCAAFGSMILNDDMDALVAANDLANRLGLDTISAGAAVAFAMECSEKGIIPDKINWGDSQQLMQLLRDIANKEGLGELLAQGTVQAAEQLGSSAEEYAVHVKGLEVPYHDPRAFTSMAVNYATSARGACHLEGLTYFAESGAFSADNLQLQPDWDPAGTEGKAELAVCMQDYLGLFNAAGLCKFLLRGGIGPGELAQWFESSTGWPVDSQGVLLVGERLFNLKRLVNASLGISRIDDCLPPRLISHPRPSGRAKGVLPQIGRMLNEYYELRGWSEEGIPLSETVDRLDLLSLGGGKHGRIPSG